MQISIINAPVPDNNLPYFSHLWSSLIYCSKVLMLHVFAWIRFSSQRILWKSSNILAKRKWSISSFYSLYSHSISKKIQSNISSLSLYGDTKLNSMLLVMLILRCLIHFLSIIIFNRYCSNCSRFDSFVKHPPNFSLEHPPSGHTPLALSRLSCPFMAQSSKPRPSDE